MFEIRTRKRIWSEKCVFGLQDGAQNDSRSASDGSKTLTVCGGSKKYLSTQSSDCSGKTYCGSSMTLDFEAGTAC